MALIRMGLHVDPVTGGLMRGTPLSLLVQLVDIMLAGL